MTTPLHTTPSPAPTGADRTNDTLAEAPGPRPGPAADDVTAVLAPAELPDELGRRGPYRILDLVGRGGMGTVFRAEDPQLKRQIALKVMLPHLAADPTARRRFLREAEAQAAVEHDHIVPIYQVGEDRGVPYIAMPLLKGQTLSAALRANPAPPLGEVLRVGREIAAGLAAAHDHGLVHRDIKPGNIWLEGPRRRVRILDFGLARSAAEPARAADEPRTAAGEVVGTPAYMSPEQARGRPVDHRTDLFSLGVVLYQMATGEPPFKGPSPLAILSALAADDPVPPQTLNPGLPPALDALIRSLLSKAPADRPATAAAVEAELGQIERDLTAVPTPPAAGAGGADPWAEIDEPDPSQVVRSSGVHRTAGTPARPGRRWLAAAIGLLVLGGAAVTGYELVFKTPHGRMVVEIDDPRVEARFKDGELRLYDPAGKLQYTIKASERDKELPAGRYRIEVKGADGLKVDVPEFKVEKDGKVTVRVSLAQPAKKDPPAVPKVGPRVVVHPDRALAEWALSKGGSVGLVGRDDPVAAGKDLPPGPVTVSAVVLTDYALSDADLDRFRGATSLGVLVAPNAAVTDVGLEALSRLPLAERLYNLSLRSPRLTDAGWAHLPRFRALTTLNAGRSKIGEAGAEVIAKLPGLAVLSVEETGTTDAWLARWSHHKLHHLNVASTRVTDDGLKAIRGMTSLRVLWLKGNEGITDAGLAHLGDWTQLTSLHLSGTKVTRASLPFIARNTGLVELNLGTLPLDDADVAALKPLQKLTTLYLNEGTRITDRAVEQLPAFPALRTLYVQNTALTDAGLATMRQVKGLRLVALQGTKVTARGVAGLREALPDCKVEWDGP